MPVFNSRTVIELARGIRAFLNLEAGLTRGEIPARDPDAERRELARVRSDSKRKSERLPG